MAYKLQAKSPINKLRSRKIGAILIVILVILLGTYMAYTRLHHSSTISPGKSNTPAIHYEPSSSDEKKESDDAKDQIVKDQKQTPAPSDPAPTPGSSTAVTPTITRAVSSGTTVDVGSYVRGIIEDGGTCTLTAIQGAKSLVRTQSGIANASNTVCPMFSVEKSAFPSGGSWSVVISYKSARASGASSASIVEIAR